MFKAKVDLTIDVELKDECRLMCSMNTGTYNVTGFIDTNICLGDTKINLSLKSLWDVLNDQNLLKEFRNTTNKCILELKENFSKKCKGKVLRNFDYYEDISINYHKDCGHFCITVCTQEALNNMEKRWNDFLDKEWENYLERYEDIER